MKHSTEQSSKEYLFVNCCGIDRIYQRDTLALREHGRMDYHILYIAEGRCYAEVGGQSVIAEAGSLILYMPGKRQKYSFKGADRSVSCYWHFAGTGAEKLLYDFGFVREGVYHVGKSQILLSVLEKTEREQSLKNPYYEAVCAAYLLEFLALAGRKSKSESNRSYQKNKQMIDRVCDQMLAEYMHRYPLQRYADFCNLSLGRFSHLFKESMGLSPYEYLMRIRIEKARQLLGNTMMSVSEVAERTGFTGQNYFSRTFKRYTGKSPRAFMMEEYGL
ncbi:MAG: helix-turn-helix transcriptional regulator [Clostridia bacterium]|nr:helix-turn-helix transcriptional regulator [Clostridia bacterium]